MKKIREYIQCRRFIYVLAILFSIVAMRIFSTLYVSQTGIEGTFFNRIAETITIQATSSDDHWAEIYPSDKTSIEKFEDDISKREKKIQAFCISGFPGYKRINKLVTYFKSELLKCNIENDPKEYGASLYVKSCVSNLADFNEYCTSINIPFVYFATPCQDSVNYYQNKTEEVNNWTIVNRSEALATEIEEVGIDTYVIAKEDKTLIHNFSFDASTHWFTRDALFATEQIVKVLNSKYSFNINEELFDKCKYKDLMKDYPNQKNEITSNMGYDFEFLIPIEEGLYEMSYAEGQHIYKGSFTDTFVKPSKEWSLGSGAYHDMFNMGNYLLYDIQNKSFCCNEKKVLIIGDSFDWPIASFLSQGVREVVVIHNASFMGSIEAYIENYNPDAVLIVYNDAEYYEIYTEDAFYLH